MQVRPIRPDDGDRLRAFHQRLSFDTVYFRFFSPHPELSDAEVERFTHVDHADRVALVATEDDDIVAVARYDRLAGTDEAEVAFVVADDHQGRGIGSRLLQELAAVARANGVHRFVAETLPSNHRMLAVFRHAGYPVESRFADGVVYVSFPISVAVG